MRAFVHEDRENPKGSGSERERADKIVQDYLTDMDQDSTADTFPMIGLPWPVLFPHYSIVGVPIVECGATFSSPVRYGDTMKVTASIAWVKDKTFRVDYAVVVGDRHCASGFEVRAWVAKPTMPGERVYARSIPAEVAAKLNQEARV